MEGWLFIIVVWLAVYVSPDLEALGESTAAFVDLVIHRSRSNLAIARVSLWLYTGQMMLGAVIGWSQNESSYLLGYFTSWPVIVMGWMGFPIFIAWLIRHRRRQGIELRRMLELRHQLFDDDVPQQEIAVLLRGF